MLRRWLEHPLTRGLSLDDPATTALRRQIVASKPFLRHIYQDWYAQIAQRIPAGSGLVLELGAGAGFLEAFVPGVVKSEVFVCPGVAVVLDACHMPIRRGALRAIVMTDVLHHVPDVRRFFADAADAVRPGGAIIMVEPWVSSWSRLIYSHLHHEPFDVRASRWELEPSGPLSGANGALPWIVLQRDRRRFEREFPQWAVEEVRPGMPFRYLVSGGVSMRALMPSWTTPLWRIVERAFEPVMDQVAMFATLVLRRTETTPRDQEAPA